MIHPADEKLDALAQVADRLTELLVLDCQAFEAHRPHEVAARAEETARLANIYRHESSRLRSEPALVKAASAERRLRLSRSVEAMEAVLARHGRALHAAKVVTEGLVQAIAKEVAAQRSAAAGAGYGPGGTQATAPSTAATAITLNRRA